jgi:hypothetical protein
MFLEFEVFSASVMGDHWNIAIIFRFTLFFSPPHPPAFHYARKEAIGNQINLLDVMPLRNTCSFLFGHYF